MSFLISILPIALLLVLILVCKLSGYLSAFITLLVTILLCFFFAESLDMIPNDFSQTGLPSLLSACLIEGLLKALFPIFLIILMAIFSYNIIVESGQFEVIKKQFTLLTDDKGILVLIIVWGFGGLLEGMAGFGTAVAIPAAILIGLGFKPFFSAFVALLGNTVATGFAALGVPVIALCNEAVVGGGASSQMISEVSAFTILQLSPLFFLIPFFILTVTDRKAIRKNIFLALYVGAVSLIIQFFSALYIGAEAPAILGSVAAILALMAIARIRKKGTVKSEENVSRLQSLKAWSVYILILSLVLITGTLCPPINTFLKNHLVSTIHIPVLNNDFRFGWISNAAFLLFIGSFIGGLIQGLSLKRLLILLCKTFLNLRTTGFTLISLIMLASVMNYTGMIYALSDGLSGATGTFYPFFAPFIGALGTFITGSDTSSNILFAKLQVTMAANLNMNGYMNIPGIHGSESNWLLAANTTGATGGKMISPQSIAITSAACSLKGEDSRILQRAIPYALVYVLIGGLFVYLSL